MVMKVALNSYWWFLLVLPQMLLLHIVKLWSSCEPISELNGSVEVEQGVTCYVIDHDNTNFYTFPEYDENITVVVLIWMLLLLCSMLLIKPLFRLLKSMASE